MKYRVIVNRMESYSTIVEAESEDQAVDLAIEECPFDDNAFELSADVEPYFPVEQSTENC